MALKIKEKSPLLASESNQLKKIPAIENSFIFMKEKSLFCFSLVVFRGRQHFARSSTSISSGNMNTCTRIFLFIVHVHILVIPIHCFLEENVIKNSNNPPVSHKYFVTFSHTCISPVFYIRNLCFFTCTCT